MFSVFFYLYMFLIILSKFSVIFISIFFIYNLLVWSSYCTFLKQFNNFIYLSIPKDNGTQQGRVGISYALKCKSKTREFPVSQHPVYLSLMSIFYFDKFLLDNAYHAFNYMLTEKFLKPSLCSTTKLPKIPKVINFLFLFIEN